MGEEKSTKEVFAIYPTTHTHTHTHTHAHTHTDTPKRVICFSFYDARRRLCCCDVVDGGGGRGRCQRGTGQQRQQIATGDENVSLCDMMFRGGWQVYLWGQRDRLSCPWIDVAFQVPSKLGFLLFIINLVLQPHGWPKPPDITRTQHTSKLTPGLLVVRSFSGMRQSYFNRKESTMRWRLRLPLFMNFMVLRKMI